MNATAITAQTDVSAMTASLAQGTGKAPEVSFGNVLSRALGQTADTTAATENTAPMKLQDTIQLIIDVLSGKISAQQAGEILVGESSADEQEISDLLTKLFELLTADDEKKEVTLDVQQTKPDDEEIPVEAVQMLLQIIEFVQVNTSSDAEVPEELVQAVKMIFLEKSTAEIKEALQMATAESRNVSTEKPVASTAQFVVSTDSASTKQSLSENAEQIVKVQITAENITSAKQSETPKFAEVPVKIINKTQELDDIVMPSVLTAKPSEIVAPALSAETANSIAPVEQQILQTVTQQLTVEIPEDGISKVTMQLTPESLGELSIEISKKGSEISVVISAKELMTQKLIEEKLPTLMAALKTNDNIIKEIIVVPAQQSSSENLQQHMSSEFSRQNQNQPQNGQSSQAGYAESIQPAAEVKEQKTLKQGGLLWQTA